MARLSDVRQAGMAGTRNARPGRCRAVEAPESQRISTSARKTSWTRSSRKLKRRIRAPADGLVVYATSVRGSWRGSTEPLEEGVVRGPGTHLPADRSSFMAEVDVREADPPRLSPGCPSDHHRNGARQDDFPGPDCPVARCPTPRASGSTLTQGLQYRHRDRGDPDGLRTGVSCLAGIIVERQRRLLSPYKLSSA